MGILTDRLLNNLKNTPDLESFFKENDDLFIKGTTVDCLNDFIKLRDISLSHIAKMSGVGDYVYKIFSGDRKPSRDVLISLAFGMGLSVDEAQLLLRISKFSVLDSREKRDSVIIYGLMQGMSVFETDDILDKHNLVTLL